MRRFLPQPRVRLKSVDDVANSFRWWHTESGADDNKLANSDSCAKSNATKRVTKSGKHRVLQVKAWSASNITVLITHPPSSKFEMQ
jgi:hypothetical protein